jgi:MarR family transcriptional regulator, 2-MHQ and catechol-resistance regulon repressor
MSVALTRQARQMYAVFVELVRRYQFRDRDQVCCHGLSVSQCYTLELLAEGGPRTMGALAAEICLKVSTATRVVDQLVSRGLAARQDDPHDRRVCRVQITEAGRTLVARVQAEIVAEYEAVLARVPAGSREAVIEALSRLLEAFQERQRRQAGGCKAKRGASGETRQRSRRDARVRRTKPAGSRAIGV